MSRNKILLMLAALTIGTKVLAAPPLVELTSPYPYVTTVERVSAALEGAGMTIFARIDHRAAADSVGLRMPPTMVLIFGNPKGGTPLMLASPSIALDLPLRVLVRENADGQAIVSFHQAIGLVRAAGLPDANASGLTKAEVLIRDAIKHQ